MPRIIRSPESNADLIEIIRGIAKGSPAASKNVLDRIENTLERLAEQPFSGRARPELGSDLRSAPAEKYKQYVVFYRPLPDGIEVVRVLHGARDIPSLFGWTGEE